MKTYQIIIYALFAGLTIPVGALFAMLTEKIKNQGTRRYIMHFVTAVGGGILASAVAFVLAPRALEDLSTFVMVVTFVAGGLLMYLIDKLIEQKGGNAAQIISMMMDYLPEALALGAVFAHHPEIALLLAVFIGLQNLPAGFNAHEDFKNSGFLNRKSFFILLPMAFVGVVAALTGNALLSEETELVAGIMSFAGGGVIYLMFQDIAPMTKMEHRWSPALGAPIGFVIGLISEKIVGI